MLDELMKRARSYRRFDNSRPLTEGEVLSFVNDARLSASAGNLQRIRYAVITDREACDRVRENLAFAAYLKDWNGPAPSENPTAYVVLMTKTLDENLLIDIGIAAEALVLSATDKGFGGCMLKSFGREAIADLVAVDGYEPRLVIALGVPSERVVITEATGDIKYYRDGDTHVVPKLSLDAVVIKKI